MDRVSILVSACVMVNPVAPATFPRLRRKVGSSESNLLILALSRQAKKPAGAKQIPTTKKLTENPPTRPNRGANSAASRIPKGPSISSNRLDPEV